MKDCIVHIFSNRSATLINDSKATNRLCIFVLLLIVFLTPFYSQAQHLDNRKRLDSFQRARTASSSSILRVLANTYNVTGGGAYCSGGSGVAVGLSGSQQDTTYQLQLGGVNIGSPIPGDGNAISLGLQTAAGTYTVVANTSTGPMAMNGNVTVTINPLPTVTADPKQVCFGNNSVALTGTPAGGTWSGTGVSGSTFNANGLSAGNYTVTYSYTDANSCTNTTTATVTVNALPTVTCHANSSVCISASSFVLTGSTPVGGTYSGTGVSSGNFNPSTAGVGQHTITYTYTDGNGCTNNCTFNITVTTATTTANAGPDQTGAATCGLTSATLAANTPTAGTGNWSIVSGAGGTITTPSDPASTFTGTAGTTYTLRWTITNPPCAASTDDVIITFNQIPTTANAGSDQTLCATTATLAGNTATVGTGTWTLISGTGSITTPGSPTSAITGLGVGANTFRWTISNAPCTATFDEVVITRVAATTTANAGPDQTGAATCGLTTVTLAANSPTAGTGSWSIVSGTGGTITTPSGPTSTFTGIAGTTYTLRWTITNPPCATSTDDVVITFNQIPTTANAGPDQTDAATCGLTSVTLAANTPTAGTGTWSIVSGAGGTIATPSSPTSTFSGTAGTTYTLRWTITSSPCTASTDDVIITFNGNPTTANAGSDQTLCATTATLAGNTVTVGTGTWTLISGAGTITTPNSPTSGITALGVGANTFRWTISNAPCTATFDEVVITRVAATTTANAGPDQTGAATCGLTSATLAANTPTAGTGNWSIVSGAGGTITTPSDPASTFTGTAGTTYTLRWTITNPPCATSTDDVIITFNRIPTTANAGSDQTLCATTATLAGNTATVGTGTWTLISGTGSITTPGSPTSAITGLGVGANTFRWTISNAPCTATFDEVVITRVAATTTANAGPDQTGAATCGLTTVTLAANSPTAGTGSWSIVSGAGGTITTPSGPTSTFTGTAGTTYTLRWTITNPPCATSTDDVVITFNQIPTTANAGPDQTGAATCGLTSVTLAANTPTAGTGTWSIVSGTGGTIATPSSPTSTFSGTAGTTYTLRWTISSSPCTASTDDVVITFNRNPTIANAGSDQTLCAATATLAGNAATVGTGTWTLISGAGTITTPNSPTSGITALGVGANTFRWTISNAPCTATFDEVVITRVAATTTANAGPDQTGAATCGLTSATLAANTPTAGTGIWSIVSGIGGTITTPSDPASTFTGTAGTTYTLRWTITNPPCATSTDDVIITFNRIPTTANAGSDQTLCATTATLAGNTATVGTGTWTLISGTGSITTPGSATSAITGLGVGANTFRWTISNAPCTTTFDEVVITRVAATTTANAGPDQIGATTCGLTSVTLAANTPTAGTGNWSIVSGTGGTITTPSSPTSTFTGTPGSTYTLSWTITNPPCASSTDNVTITFNRNPTTASAGTAQSVCIGGNVTLAANAPTVGTGLWSIVSGPSTSTAQFSSTTNPTATFTPTGAGSYVLRWTISNAPCTASTATVTITVNALPAIPTISAGAPTTFCQGGSVTLTSSSATGNQWSLNGTAISGATNQTYSATTGGSYTVTVTNGNGCSRTSAATTVTVNPIPTITVNPAAPAAFCTGGSVTLTASGANTYTWSPAEGLSITTGSTVIATPEVTTTYTVTGTGANGCTNTATVAVTVTPTPDGDITSSPPVCSGNNSGTITLSNYTGTIVRWESSTNGGSSWTTINNTSTTQSYSNLTQTTIYRVLLTLNNGCDGYSDVGIIPVNEPFTPTVTVNPPVICEGQSATLRASDYGAPPFPLEDFGNANPAGWSGNDANNNNEDENTDWGETGDGKVRSGKEYNSQAPPTNTKFMIVAGTTDGADQTAALITPPFSLVGVVNPIFGYMTALDFNAGTVGKVEISIDGGLTYTTLETFTGPAKVGDGNNGFVQRNYNLSAYIGQPDVRVRFNYFGTAGSIWAVDNVGLQGTFEPVTYQWSPLTYMTPAAGNTQTVSVTPPAGTHSYCVVATTGAGCASQPVCGQVEVKPLPTCSITGNNTVCPGSTNTYSAPAIAGYTYNWAISGGATISGSATGQTVTVVANNTCGTYMLTLTTTLNGCASAPCTFVVNIVDNTAPVATAPASQSFQCLTDVPAAGTLTATDNCSGNITSTGVDVQVANGCGYTITRTWTFTDACNNTSSVSQIINVLDNTPPVAPAAPASQTFQCLADVPAAGTLTATDNCSGNITATGVDVQVAKACGFTITRTWTFTDACNNTSSVSQIINVQDDIPPVITCAPAQVFCIVNSNTYTIPPATASDNCNGTLNITYQITGATTRSGTGNDASGVFNVGISTITWTVTDTCGNTSTCTTTVTINPKPAPVITHN